MIGVILVLVILIIAYTAYLLLNMPVYQRIINKLGNSMWLVDKTGVGEGASFYIKFGRFEHSNGTIPSGTVRYTKYGQNKAFDYESDLNWSQVGNSLRVGQMKLTISENTLKPIIMMVNNVEAADAWTAPLKEVISVPSGKL